ncbi:trace amine-associated receptor 7e-like [Betta splendens]|uniref:Trace amine-associated receptor 7e-like n=1 Tax=Betta splendens TaxID=158456 RepID=A0A9W2XXF5_BETSP|nr:trace amine-associated receptor 7e-like [Betta splendens]
MREGRHPVSLSLVMETLKVLELCFPQLVNSSCRKHLRPQSEAMLTYSVLSCISLLTVCLNLLVIISISHFRQLHTPTNLLLLSLAVSDFIVGLVVMPFQILLTEPCWPLGDLMCAVFFFFGFNTICSSIANMVLISVDRYVAICEPLRYLNNISQRRVRVCVLSCWLYCGFYTFMMLKDNLKQPGRFNSCHGQCVVNELKAARTLGVVVAVFLMCYCPYFCVSLSGYNLMMGSSVNTFINCLILLNSCLNPLIYAFFYPWFRKSIKIIVTLKILQQNSCQENIL